MYLLFTYNYILTIQQASITIKHTTDRLCRAAEYVPWSSQGTEWSGSDFESESACKPDSMILTCVYFQHNTSSTWFSRPLFLKIVNGDKVNGNSKWKWNLGRGMDKEKRIQNEDNPRDCLGPNISGSSISFQRIFYHRSPKRIMRVCTELKFDRK